VTHLVIPRRFNGPASSGNGGWTAGALAELSGLAEPVTVQLRLPPPLETPLELVSIGETVELRAGDEVVAVAQPGGGLEWAAFAPVRVEEARALEQTYAGHRSHPFPRCFSCGPARDDGLRIFPGRRPKDGPKDDDVEAGDEVAASWTPAPSVAGPDGAVGTAVTWAALDCIGGWSSDLEHRPLVLASMTARVEWPPQAGSAYALVGRVRRTEGRKTWTASAMFDAAGALVAQAEHLWIAVAPEVVARLQSQTEPGQTGAG
jgi:hypothetical protein